MYDRFKPFRLEGIKEDCHVVNESGMDALDFILAMNLLSRTVYDKKLKLIFDLCDDDDDGCMTPQDILSMLQRLERVFAKECAKVVLESAILDNFVADRKAEQNFHFIMGMIKHLSLKKNKNLKIQNEKAEASPENSNSKKKNEEENV